MARLRKFSGRKHRKGAIIPLMAVLMVVMVGIVAFGYDIGVIALVRAQLQNGADAAALAAAAENV